MTRAGFNRWAARNDANANEIVTGLRQVGVHVEYVKGTGLPDLAWWYRGRSGMMEVKAKGGKLRQRQKDLIKAAAQHGVTIPVVRTLNEALEAVGFEEWRQDLWREVGLRR